MNEANTTVQIAGPILAVCLGVTLITLLVLAGSNVFRRYLGVSRGVSTLLFFLSLAAALGLGVYRARQFRDGFDGRFFEGGGIPPQVTVALAALFAGLSVPFAAKLYRRLIAGELSEAEKCSGAQGVRAWLRGGNLACAILIPICACGGLGYSFWAVLALTLLALLIYPVFNFISTASSPESTKTGPDSLSNERERVLKMLDEGKITAPEAGELLNVLTPSQTSENERGASTPAFSPHQRMVLAGVAILLIGFFLPWFTYDTNKEMNRMMSGFQVSVPGGPANIQMPAITTGIGSIHVAGGDIRHGLGWLVLLLGIVTAVLPYVTGSLTSRDRQLAVLGGLSIGALILLYLLTQNMRFVSIGILLAMAGYALQFIGTLKGSALFQMRTAHAP